MPLALPKSRREIAELQRARKRAALAQARRAPFYAGKLDHVDADRLDDADEWRKIPILTKDVLRGLTDAAFYREFCVSPADGVAEYWRSGGMTGAPLFYPRSFADIRYALLSFARTFHCIGCKPGETAHLSFPLGIHPAGQIYARCATAAGIAVNWAGAGTTTPSQLQLELIQRLKPSIWLGMSSYGLHLANLAEAQGIDLAAGSVGTVICSAEPLSEAKRGKLARMWGARVRDTFGMTEAGMMGAEDETGQGLRVWSDMYFIEVVDPQTTAPVDDGKPGCLVVTPLWTNNVTPFLRWNSGDIVVRHEADDGTGPFAVFPIVKHAHRTAGFFKVRGININHAEFEDFMFADHDVGDFKCEAVSNGGLDALRVSVEFRRGTDPGAAMAALAQRTKTVFELSPDIIVLEPGTLAREFEASVKAPRFADTRR
ncbi:MAG: phenylacetate--CoA ligase family protein [Proteobacteria bacterium]|nr:phenylacetate--CoA ligase family protein [Pseudomonadota bacterium]